MNHYYQIASQYFHKFEGSNFFPGPKSLHWYLWLVSLSGFIYYAYQVFIAAPKDDLPYWQMIGTETAFLLSCILIALYRFKESVRSNCKPSDMKPIDRLHLAKRAQIEALLGCSAGQFIIVSEEIIKLRSLEKAFRSPLDPDLSEVWKKAFDKDSKARVMSIIMSILGLIVGLVGKNSDTNLFEVLSDANTQKLIVGVLALAISIFFLGITTFILVRLLLEVLSWFASIFFPGAQNSETTLNYLIRDLIKYYTPEQKTLLATAPTEPPAQRQAALTTKSVPSSGFVVAAVALQAICMAWQSTKRKPRP